MDRSELANLTAFVAVADRRSFRAAASQLGVTPSALSHSMRLLEERLGWGAPLHHQPPAWGTNTFIPPANNEIRNSTRATTNTIFAIPTAAPTTSCSTTRQMACAVRSRT